jgi:hypothetical protein
MANNIAFIGSFGTNKTQYKNFISDLLSPNVASIVENISQTMLTNLEDKYKDYFEESYELQLSCAFMRRVEMLSIDSSKHIVSDNCAINELAQIMVVMNELQHTIERSAQVLGPDGKPIMTENYGQFVIIQAVFQVLLNQVALEKDFWNFLYYSPIYEPEDGMLDEDGVKPKDRLRQKELDIALKTLIRQLKLNVIVLPSIKTEALKFLESEKRKWEK